MDLSVLDRSRPHRYIIALMSATSPKRRGDPRVVRSRAAVHEAARTLFLQEGYAGTTMDDIAAAAGIARRTLYNNYAGKDALFLEIMDDATAFAGAFAKGVREEFAAEITAGNLAARLHDLGQRLALGILRPEVIALRRLLVAEARLFPALAARYFDRAPGQVLEALAAGFARLAAAGVLHIADPKTTAAQFAYLVVGEPLDHAMLTGAMPSQAHVTTGAREGVTTFLARYGTS
jgi:TetR/AcrR family transcriptional regulator, mexJK operon transcriptional repressor